MVNKPGMMIDGQNFLQYACFTHVSFR